MMGVGYPVLREITMLLNLKMTSVCCVCKRTPTSRDEAKNPLIKVATEGPAQPYAFNIRLS